jgi:diguanylate cyclase (GGDEF)-like protein
VGITRDINELRQVEQALQHLATHDPLTDLPNRFLMVDRMSQLLARGRRSGTAFGVVFMDIDRFKDVNDAHGHEFGDLLLRAVADRLRTSVRQSDTVARVGGDEFVVIVDSMRAGEAETVASNIQRALAASFALQRHRMDVAVSIGISLYPDNGTDADTLLRAADYAMYMAKRAGGNRYMICVPGTPKPGEVLQRP